jgi:transcriptional regulator of acetoin/glycerol metabolism
MSGATNTFFHPSLAEIVMNQRTASTLAYLGSVAAAVLAASLSSGNALAQSQLAGPFEGGQSANTFATAPFTSKADRATVSAEGRDAARHLDSRSGYQSSYGQAMDAPFISTRSRTQVREEAVAASHDTQVFEGGQTGTIVTRVARPAATMAGSATASAQ